MDVRFTINELLGGKTIARMREQKIMCCMCITSKNVRLTNFLSVLSGIH